MIVHALDGYDEISLTGDTKMISKTGEKIYSAEDLKFKNVSAESIFGGETKEEASKLFIKILEGNGTEEQNSVVLANASIALENTGKYGNYDDCLALAKESLESGKALNSLQLLVDG